MALKLHRIENLLVKKKSNSTLVKIMVEYATLKQQLENAPSQSWYFKQAVASNTQRLETLTEDFEVIRELFNNVPIDLFIHKINENNSIRARYKGKGMNAVLYMVCTALGKENEFLSELVRLKSKTKTLMPLVYYLQQPEEFLKFID
ncbi:hypothetical protein [Arenibacter lacus]|uniref:hypothetical protein n=1 Tax=Arenibacter lacus TaxID=2608629 RepID=UPI00123D7850|nr:hypothetical protein [Arenibacter lacus]